MQLDMIFTNDWELFGEGSGDFHQIQERPLREILAVLSRHQAHLTIFAEIGQQWAHRALGEKEPWARALADRWEESLRQSVKAGHDVQLHLHPTWLGAKWEDQRWNLKLSQWALASLNPTEISSALLRGRTDLENLLQPVA